MLIFYAVLSAGNLVDLKRKEIYSLPHFSSRHLILKTQSKLKVTQWRISKIRKVHPEHLLSERLTGYALGSTIIKMHWSLESTEVL